MIWVYPYFWKHPDGPKSINLFGQTPNATMGVLQGTPGPRPPVSAHSFGGNPRCGKNCIASHMMAKKHFLVWEMHEWSLLLIIVEGDQLVKVCQSHFLKMLPHHESPCFSDYVTHVQDWQSSPMFPLYSTYIFSSCPAYGGRPVTIRTTQSLANFVGIHRCATLRSWLLKGAGQVSPLLGQVKLLPCCVLIWFAEISVFFVSPGFPWIVPVLLSSHPNIDSISKVWLTVP